MFSRHIWEWHDMHGMSGRQLLSAWQHGAAAMHCRKILPRRCCGGDDLPDRLLLSGGGSELYRMPGWVFLPGWFIVADILPGWGLLSGDIRGGRHVHHRALLSAGIGVADLDPGRDLYSRHWCDQFGGGADLPGGELLFAGRGPTHGGGGW